MVEQLRNTVALRMDDVGASSKRYEVYSKSRVLFRGREIFHGNWLFFKYFPPFRAWGPYRELAAREWVEILKLVEHYGAKLTVGVTAAWVEDEYNFIPYPDRYPRSAAALREGVRQGLVEIANHGLTHCVVQGNLFRPRLMRGNRRFHREFLEWVPREVHKNHLQRAQEILCNYFDVDIVTFVPPGNKFTNDTLQAAADQGLKYVSCDTDPREAFGLKVLGNQKTIPFHDRDLVLGGIDWFQKLLESVQGSRLVFIRELWKYSSETLHTGNTSP